MAEWFYRKGDQQFGPVSITRLRELARQRVLTPNDLIFREGLPAWVLAGNTKGLFDNAPNIHPATEQGVDPPHLKTLPTSSHQASPKNRNGNYVLFPTVLVSLTVLVVLAAWWVVEWRVSPGDVSPAEVTQIGQESNTPVPEALAAVLESKHPATTTAVDDVAAAISLRRAAEEGDLEAQYNLGIAYGLGQGVLRSDEEAANWFRKAADQGHALAQLILGYTYSNGRGVAKNDEEAATWFRKSADQGNDAAQYILGGMYANGEGVAQSNEEAVRWYRKAADQGNEVAQTSLGLAYGQGRGVPQSDDEAVKWYRKAADQGYAEAQLQLGLKYVGGRGVPESVEEAAKWFLRAADQGNAAAQLMIGLAYSDGQGVQKSDDEAAKWLGRAAESGHAEAQFQFALQFRSGRGVEKSDQQAAKWFRRAADQGLDRAQLHLGLAYMLGRGVAQNVEEAAKLFRKAADQGYVEAEFMLGGAYEFGKGVPKSEEEAAKWYQKAADQGNAEAQFKLGAMHADGRVVLKSDEEAVKWYRKAAEGGSPTAATALGRAYVLGIGVPQDEREGTAWIRKAAEQGDPDGQFFLGFAYAAGVGVIKTDSAALEWLFKSAQGYLANGSRDKALRSYDQMKALAPDHFLVASLFAQLYPAEARGGPARFGPDQSRRPGQDGDGSQKAASSGTAWPIAEGYVVTNNHVVVGASKITLVRTNGSKLSATVVAKDAANDLALLRVADALQLPSALPLASRPAVSGERVFTLGYPLPDIMGAKPKLTDGIVSATTGVSDDPRAIQITAALQAGNSGGPLLNSRGEVVGIAMAKLNAVAVFKWTGDLPENVGYAVKVAYLVPLLDSVPKAAKPIEVLPAREASLTELTARIQDSVMMVIAE